MTAADHLERLIDGRIVRLDLARLLEMGFGLRDIADLEVEEGKSLQGAGMVGRDPDGHVPLVERARVVVLVGQDPRVQVVRVGEMRMPLEPVHRDSSRGVELSLATQGFAQPQEHEALWILRELRRERADLVSHC